jgi:protein KTI12
VTAKHTATLKYPFRSTAAMPLVMMCGLPCSGKTLRAQQIAAFIAASDLKAVPVHVINDESLHLDRNEAYKGAQRTRGGCQ